MSCSCNCSPCNCQPRPSTCCTPTTESVLYTFENANLTGIGFFDNETDYLVQFRGAVSNSAALTITLNAVDNTLVWDFDDEALVADLPDATTTQRGILETATNAEALAKAATDKILTPSNLAAIGSTDTFAGLVELATNAETITGTSTTLAVTPAGLAAAAGTYKTTTFANAVARGGAFPDFDGQFGTQLDADTAWIAASTTPGDWLPLITLGGLNESPGSNTSITLGGDTIALTGPGTFELNAGAAFTKTGTGIATFTGGNTNFTAETVLHDGGSTTFGGINPQIIDFGALATWYASNVQVPASSLMGQSNTSTVTSFLISDFISTFNTQTGWVSPTGVVSRAAWNSYPGQVVSNPPTQAEVQAIDDYLVVLSQRLAALVQDLLAVKLPAA